MPSNDTAMKDETQETSDNAVPEALAKILAEMRADEIETEDGIVRLDGYADRVEAAVDRMRDAYCDICKEKDAAYDQLLLERDKALKMSAPGNVAAIREALEMFVNHASCLYHCDIHRLYPNTTKCDGVLADEGECPMKPECDAVFAGRIALAAPAKNCDRFATAREAANAWQAYSVVHRDRDYSLMAAFNWLFAKANPETKGEVRW